MRRWPRLVVAVGVLSLAVAAAVAVARDGSGSSDQPEFVKGVLAGVRAEAVTTLQYGPDGRLYVGQQDGLVRALTVKREGPGRYRAEQAENLRQLQALPNHDDDGAVNKTVRRRLLTGLLVTGTATAPVVYAVTSDPRLPGPSAPAPKLPDTNSGVLSRLSRDPGGAWQRQDLVRGLPRSRHDHASNGLALDRTGRTLFIAQGGNTNKGAPAPKFNLLPEYALSAAILSVDLTAVGEGTYDLPTLDDPARPGAADEGDPFGGAGGANQAQAVPGGPVQVYAPGLRNPYDLVVTEAGRLYTIDNGANEGFGAAPLVGDGGACSDAPRPGGSRELDSLHRVTGRGYYGGHPDPARGQCRYEAGARRHALVTFNASTNGLAEYTSRRAFRGAMAGDLLAASFDNTVYRLRLGPGGRFVGGAPLFEDVGQAPLDLTTVGDEGPFPGTVWVGDVGDGSITVYEPESL